MPDNLIERAREFLAREGYLGGIPASAVAAFTRSVLNDWKVIEVDGLPEEDGFYLVSLQAFNKDGDLVGEFVEIRRYEKRSQEWLDMDGTEMTYDRVIAWQKLPAPYQPQGEGKDETARDR